MIATHRDLTAGYTPRESSHISASSRQTRCSELAASLRDKVHHVKLGDSPGLRGSPPTKEDPLPDPSRAAAVGVLPGDSLRRRESDLHHGASQLHWMLASLRSCAPQCPHWSAQVALRNMRACVRLLPSVCAFGTRPPARSPAPLTRPEVELRAAQLSFLHHPVSVFCSTKSSAARREHALRFLSQKTLWKRGLARYVLSP